MRGEPAYVRGPQGGRATGNTSEAHQATELTGRRKPGRPKSKMAHTLEVIVPDRDCQNEAVRASGEDAEMMDIPTEEGQDIDMGLVVATPQLLPCKPLRSMPQQPATRNTTTPRGAGGAGGSGAAGGAAGAGREEGATADIGLVGSLEPGRDDFIGQILPQQMRDSKP